MSTKQRQILILEESNLANATKIEHEYRFKQFFKNSTITSYDELTKVPNEELENTLVDYCKFILHKVSLGKLSPNAVPKMFKPIKFVLWINYRENYVRWPPIESLFPPEERRSGYGAWTTEQIQEMIDRCSGTNISRNKALVHFMASIGGRIGIHEHTLLMKHLIPMSSNDTQNMDCYAVLYAESYESAEEKDYLDSSKDVVSGDSYWEFLTPEATKWLKRYHDSNDKYDFVEPSAKEFENLGVNVWFDKFNLEIGDSVFDKIEEGLKDCKYGVVVLSKHFLQNFVWPRQEYTTLKLKEIRTGKKVILPIWMTGISKINVFDYSEELFDRWMGEEKVGISKLQNNSKKLLRNKHIH